MFANVTVYAAGESCTGLFGPKLIAEVKNVFSFIRILVPIILALLTMLDFAKAVFNQDKDGLNKAKNNFLKRAIAALVVFFAPYIVVAIMELVDGLNSNCVSQFN